MIWNCHIPPRKMNDDPKKGTIPKGNFFRPIFFRGYVSFQGCFRRMQRTRGAVFEVVVLGILHCWLPCTFATSCNFDGKESLEKLLGGGFKYFSCSALFGEDVQFDEHIFQMGWNHQPGYFEAGRDWCLENIDEQLPCFLTRNWNKLTWAVLKTIVWL